MTPGLCECCGARPPTAIFPLKESQRKVCAECFSQLNGKGPCFHYPALEVRPAREVVWREDYLKESRFTIERDATGRYFINVPDGEQAMGLDRERLWLLVYALIEVLCTSEGK